MSGPLAAGIQLAAGAEPAALFAAWLRDRLSIGVVEPWSGEIPAALDTRPLHHLPPPRDTPDPRAELWRSAFRPGLCYYRMGPGFIQVKDIREPAEAARLTIDRGSLIEAFLRCLRPVRLTEAGRAERAALDQLLAERLLLRFGDIVTTAPCRMLRWPIPARFA